MMDIRLVFRLALVAGAVVTEPGNAFAKAQRLFTSPDVIVSTDGRRLDVERGLFIVPENRRNPATRSIPIHFIRAKARKPRRSGLPIMLLPGGPGYDYDFSRTKSFDQLKRLSQHRDVVYVSQRGFPGAPGLVPELRAYFDRTLPLDRPMKLTKLLSQERRGVAATLRYWRKRGVDVNGYDILNIVDDVYELRDALGYDKIILRGCSFGSQWSFAYLKRWPETVDRALLSGVEPLDFAYDSPRWIWDSLGRLSRQAEKSSTLRGAIPPEGLLEVIKTLVQRLEKNPVSVELVDPSTDAPVTVVVGADDLRTRLRGYSFLMRSTAHANLAHWPRFVLEMTQGDFRFLAALALESRKGEAAPPLITYSIDNSIGITKDRDTRLLREAENRWLAMNQGYRATRRSFSAIDVGDAFRADQRSTVPTLLVSGDLDWSTPIENAEHALGFLKIGHLVTVKGATHCPLNREEQLLAQQPATAEALRRFVDLEFDATSAAEFFATLPKAVELQPIEFAPVTETSLYDEWLDRRKTDLK